MRFLMLLATLLLVAACNSQPMDVSELPVGDPERGAVLYTESINGAPTCSSCHALTDERMTGPGLAGYGEIAGTRVEGQSAEEYTYEAIMQPSAHLVEGYGNLMYAEYRSRLSAQQVADLIAYLLILTQ